MCNKCTLGEGSVSHLVRERIKRYVTADIYHPYDVEGYGYHVGRGNSRRCAGPSFLHMHTALANRNTMHIFWLEQWRTCEACSLGCRIAEKEI